MGSGKAYGVDRAYQVLCRDVLGKRAASPLAPYAGDGIDVPLRLGSADRTFDVALVDLDGRIIVAECRRTKDPVKLTDLDAFAHRVELVRRFIGGEVAGVYFTKTAYQEGAVKAAEDSGIQVAVCVQDQPLSSFSLVFHRYDAERHRRFRNAEAWAEDTVTFQAVLNLKVIRADGTVVETETEG